MFHINILPHAEEPRSGVSKHGGWVTDSGVWYYANRRIFGTGYRAE
jgi:hypothetical protein